MEKQNIIDPLIATYYPSLDQEISTSIDYLHTPINWAMSLVTAIVLFLISRDTYPDGISWMALSASLILVSHFAVRSGKAYISAMRFSTIQRKILRSLLAQEGNLDYMLHIQKYHVEWQSPIPFRTVIYKLLFELGYGYLYFVILAVKVHILLNIYINLIMIIISIVCIMISVAEFYMLRVSPYLKNTFVDEDSIKLR